MIEITTLLIAYISGLCTGVVVFIILGYVFVKKGKNIENLIKT